MIGIRNTFYFCNFFLPALHCTGIREYRHAVFGLLQTFKARLAEAGYEHVRFVAVSSLYRDLYITIHWKLKA
jgi:hypothetical protein